MSRRAVVSVEALDAIAETGAVLLRGLPMTRSVPLALAQGPLLTLAALAEAALDAVPRSDT